MLIYNQDGSVWIRITQHEDAGTAKLHLHLNAKRAAFTHFLFNVIGVVWVLAVFHYFIKMVCFIIPEGTTLSAEFLRAMNVSDIASLPPEARADLLSRAVIPDRLALFHTLFNGLNILVLLPFVSQMEKIAKSKAQVEESNRYYNENAKPGSLAAKANMVAKYNAKHEKGGKK